MKHNKTRKPLISEIESLMEAEEELRSIFSQRQTTYSIGGHSNNFQLNYGTQLKLSESITSHTNSTSVSNNEVGFSNFGHFRAPIKRPSCNPLVKDERFRSLNDVNNDYSRQLEELNRLVPCDSQVVSYPYRSSYSPAPMTEHVQFPFAFSSAASPTAGSGMTFFSPLEMSSATSTTNSSWLSGNANPLQTMQP